MNSKKIRLKAYAKVNFFLSVTGIREDGYHLLSSCFQSIGIYDSVTLKRADETKVICGGEIKGENIALKAVRALEKYTGLALPSEITIKKRIPMRAGLGGGSADAAAVLKGVCRLYGLGLSADELEKIGVSVGADVPFCLRGGTVLAEGIGEVLYDLPNFPDCFLVIAKPDKGNSTPDIFKRFDETSLFREGPAKRFEKELLKGDLSGLCSLMENDLEPFAKTEETDRIEKVLKESGALAAVMTGSGSAVFGVFKTKKEAVSAMRALRRTTDCYRKITKPVNIE